MDKVAENYVGKNVIMEKVEHFAKKKAEGRISNFKYYQNIVCNFVGKKGAIVDVKKGSNPEAKHQFFVQVGKKIAWFEQEDFDLVSSSQAEIDSAIYLLRSLGYKVTPPKL